MTRARGLLAACLIGLGSAFAIAVLIAAVPGPDITIADGTHPSATEHHGPTFVLFVGPETRALLAKDAELRGTLTIIDAPDGATATALARDGESDGIILDVKTVLALPATALAELYASGRVVAMFGVDLPLALRLVAHPTAYPGQSRPASIHETVGTSGGPLVSVIYRSRPGGNSTLHATHRHEFEPRLFARLLADGARAVRLPWLF